ncbi:DUF4181 domain-containing protein [Mesobacillus sp. AQ2]|uniref:DUF4181 domain-containing protein n=1 Tax=unclassified Mesobacillus TaxID=2675270 RepID=UPI00203C4480|nr:MULTISPECIES: DUF4181 domain-containing protein [unclassified Mesobacillus]MCM3122778.1 DUF4181 domain-containing protein [Mesobacillus sp. MER 33]MCM3233739.1 DUF4181 domain-containing protein [Mesobacillus sp. MER 48]WHX42793.1 DUF4181 domain-containing protein [Mesobacillus sp. AQ2]
MKYILFVVLIITIVWLMKFLLRKAFNIPKIKRKVFSYNHINKTHRNAEWILRITTVITYLILFFKLMYRDVSVNLFLLVLTLLITGQNFLRAYFEWKASDHPKEAILSIAEGLVLIGIVLLVIQFEVLTRLTQ